jgi:phosphoribosylformimino-5-aminoimidazole carboxamide ribonucleotide (ProFAR) isomerase
MHVARQLLNVTSKQLIVGGGISSLAEVDELDSMGVDTVVGMAIYSGAIAV